MKKELLIPREKIHARVKDLADQISSDYRDSEPILVGVLKGVIIFFADLIREITLSTKMDFIRAASYGSETASSGKIRITKDVELPVAGEQILLVEDIVDTGLTLSHIMANLKEKGAESVRICALIDKLERRSVDVPIHYCGFQVKEGFIVGYGLDCNERYRHLSDIYVLK